MTDQKKKRKPYTDRTFLISESKGQYRIFLILALGCAAAFYLKTVSRTVVAGDSGELITACFTLGIAHWPGYPLYVILGNIFINLFGMTNPAHAVNLMSALFGVLTVGFLYAIIYHFTRIPFLSASIALLFAWGHTFWTQATIAEVNTLHTFLVALILFMFTLWLEKRPKRLLYLIPFLIGLACTNHQLAFLLLPAFVYMLFLFDAKPGYERFTSTGFLFLGLILLAISISLPASLRWTALVVIALACWLCFQQTKLNWRYWAAALGCFVGGLLLYLYLPIRASQSPAHNWGNPSGVSTFIHALLAPSTSQSSGGNIWIHLNYLFNPFPEFTKVIWPWSKGLWMFEFLSPVFFLFGLWGIYVGLKTGWRMARVFLLFILLNVMAIMAMSQPPAGELFKVDPYYLQAFLVFAVFIAIGIKEWLLIFGEVYRLKQYPVFGALLIIVILAAPFGSLYVNYKKVDRSGDTLAYDFALNLASSVVIPQDSILLVNKDDLFLLWYIDMVEGRIMPAYPLVPLPGMPGGEDFWLGWHNLELASEDPPRVFFPLPPVGDEWLTPEDELNSFILVNMNRGKQVYMTSFGLWDANVDLNAINFPIRPYKSAFKVLTPQDRKNEKAMISRNLDYWNVIFHEQEDQLTGYFESPAQRPGDEFMTSRYAINLYHHANWARMAGMPKEAVEFCTMALKIYPYFIEGLDLMAHLLVELGDFAKAEVYVHDLLQMYPDYHEYHLAAADFYFAQRKYRMALAECLKTLELDPGNPEAHALKDKIEAAMN